MQSMTNARSSTLSARDWSLAILVRYVLFAIIAGAINLLTQKIVFGIASVQPLAVSILAGTAAGFIVKYFLDKHWIFFDEYGDSGQEVRKVILYASFSVAMTLVFWAFEIAFLAIGNTDFAKYTGAVVGLSIGNFAKYLLDRTFTFNRPAYKWK
jgi:putative flippase GtrA